MRNASRIAIAILLLGCAPTPVEVEARFPSLETFLYSESGRLFVYDLELGLERNDCPALIDAVSRGAFGSPVRDSDWQPICSFRDRAVQFSDLPPGPHAYVMITRDDDTNSTLLSGCTVAEAYEGAPPVEITLYPTLEYAEEASTRTLTCSSANDKCQRGCR